MKERLINILNDMVNSEELGFGWSEKITKFKLISCFPSIDGMMCVCEYVERGNYGYKSVNIPFTKIRSEKLKELEYE